QGPDQEVLPAYADYKVSVSGLIKKTTNYAGTVDVRKYAAKRADAVEPAVEAPAETHLKYLSPGEVEQVCNAGMGAGMRGFATLRGNLEMTGDDFFLVVSHGGTRQQVSFLLEGKATQGLRKLVGQVVQVTGVVEKESGWGGKFQAESAEPRPGDHRAISRTAMDVVHVEGDGAVTSAEVKLNHGLTVRLAEKPGFIWAVEVTTAKRMGLREANFEPVSSGPGNREFFFTPRNPGTYDIDFFLAKAFSPAQVSKTYKLAVTVKPQPLG
ncbi:MAG TPA: protease inhibitor I42 family protein, partial [Myxococcaceae bacterium]|nr:protease inhibitor I42 family protein [Myxococcaceae bacterium]